MLLGIFLVNFSFCMDKLIVGGIACHKDTFLVLRFFSFNVAALNGIPSSEGISVLWTQLVLISVIVI